MTKRIPTRRDAIKTGLGVLGATMIGKSWAMGQTRPIGLSAQAFVTDETGKRHARFDGVLNAAGVPDAVFTFDDRDQRQAILGFGAAFTEGACVVLSRLPAADRALLFDELYNPAKNNFSIGRVCVGASDYSTTLYSYDEGAADPTLSRFSIDHDRVAVLPMLKQMRGIRPDLFLFASPWSPPGWMKYGDSMLGGSIRPHDAGVYSRYILKYLQQYRDAGVVIDAMTIQNEIDADQDGRMPACTWPEEVEAKYIARYLGPLLAREAMPTKIWILDHNYNLSGRVFDQLAKPDVKAFVNAIAWHGYDGSPEEMSAVHHRYPEVDMHWTEGGDDISSPMLLTAWSRWAVQFAGILNNGARSITTWNLALDEKGHPNLGPFHCAGILTVDSKTQAITRNGIYWALVHYAKAFPRGSRILAAQRAPGGKVTAVAARRGDGSIAVVLANGGAALRVRIDVGAASQMVSAAGNSVTSLIF